LAVVAAGPEEGEPRAPGEEKEDTMLGVGRRKLLKTIDHERVLDAIREAEKRTSGEVRVSVSLFFWGSVRRVAERAFDRMGMTVTKDRNGILFFIVPARRRFTVLGDEGIHARVGQDFWEALAALLSEYFRKGEFTEGLVRAIEAAGEKLAEYFPYDAATDVNELPDEIDFSRSRKK
jgi:uncharacterized membrane protein